MKTKTGEVQCVRAGHKFIGGFDETGFGIGTGNCPYCKIEDFENKILQQQVNEAAGLNSNLSKALHYIHEYLNEKGWGQIGLWEGADQEKWTGGFRVDPVLKQVHRGDFAFIIQTERDIVELNKSDKFNQAGKKN